jgi:hypothetical protein
LGADIFLWLNYVEANEDYASVGYYAVSSGNSVLTFWNNLSVPSSRPMKMGITTTPCIMTQKSIVLIDFTMEA